MLYSFKTNANHMLHPHKLGSGGVLSAEGTLCPWYTPRTQSDTGAVSCRVKTHTHIHARVCAFVCECSAWWGGGSSQPGVQASVQSAALWISGTDSCESSWYLISSRSTVRPPTEIHSFPRPFFCGAEIRHDSSRIVSFFPIFSFSSPWLSAREEGGGVLKSR